MIEIMIYWRQVIRCAWWLSEAGFLKCKVVRLCVNSINQECGTLLLPRDT